MLLPHGVSKSFDGMTFTNEHSLAHNGEVFTCWYVLFFIFRLQGATLFSSPSELTGGAFFCFCGWFGSCSPRCAVARSGASIASFFDGNAKRTNEMESLM
jgi:hypothetical protein